jgi:hypothetical protein
MARSISGALRTLPFRTFAKELESTKYLGATSVAQQKAVKKKGLQPLRIASNCLLRPPVFTPEINATVDAAAKSRSSLPEGSTSALGCLHQLKSD